MPAAILLSASHPVVALTSPMEAPPEDAIGYAFGRSENYLITWVEKGIVDAAAFSNQDWDERVLGRGSNHPPLRIFHESTRYPRALELVRGDLPPAIGGMQQQSEAAFIEQSRSTLADRGTQLAGLLSIGLAKPLYYFDLRQVRDAVAPALAQPDVSDVRVYDPAGRLAHDGSSDIDEFGQPMSNPLAAEITAAQTPLVLWAEDVVDASAPLAIGEERLGGVRVGLSLARIGEAVARERQAADRRYAEAFAGPVHRLYIGLFVLGAWFVAALAFVARGLVLPIRALARHAGDIARGLPVEPLDSHRQDEPGELIRAFRRMSEAVRRHEPDIRRLADYDSLTGLANRLRFREVLEATLAGPGSARRSRCCSSTSTTSSASTTRWATMRAIARRSSARAGWSRPWACAST